MYNTSIQFIQFEKLKQRQVYFSHKAEERGIRPDSRTFKMGVEKLRICLYKALWLLTYLSVVMSKPKPRC